jgi:hypothetical protein
MFKKPAHASCCHAFSPDLTKNIDICKEIKEKNHEQEGTGRKNNKKY